MTTLITRTTCSDPDWLTAKSTAWRTCHLPARTVHSERMGKRELSAASRGGATANAPEVPTPSGSGINE